MTRSIPPSLAPVLEHLELERPSLVSVEEIGQIAARHGVRTPGKIIAHRLAQRGWLLPTEVRGVWEFAPAERAGPISDPDPLTTLRAARAVHPELRAALALGSALWLLDMAERNPDPHEVSVHPKSAVPSALRRAYRVVRHAANLEPSTIKKVPVHQPATVLVHLAHHPGDARSWSEILERLPDLVHACAKKDIVTELAGRPHATSVRLAYLLSGVAPELVSQLGIEPGGKVWFGPRRRLRRHNARWNVADTVLPFNPAELGPRP